MRVTVIGTGYVGLVTGTCLSDMGHEVVCVDIDRKKIDALNEGRVFFYEPGLAEIIQRNREHQRLLFTTDIADGLKGSEICFIAVGTPENEDGAADTQHVLAAATSIGAFMTSGLLVAVKSTVPPGTCAAVEEQIRQELDRRRVDYWMEVVSNPEFLKEGQAVTDFQRPDRIVVGGRSEGSLERMRKLYNQFIRNGHPFLTMSVASSEVTKYAANAMLAARISLINEMALICDAVGADVMAVRHGIGSDKRIGMSFLYPGLGYGGSCFPKDVRALSRLAQAKGVSGTLLRAVDEVNERQKLLLGERIIKYFGGQLSGKRIGIWGLSFKPNTDDIREAPALVLIRQLIAAGATISAYDPEAMDNTRRALAEESRVHFAVGLYGAAENCDALAIVTEWGEFRNPNFELLKTVMKTPVVFDGRNLMEPKEMAERGFTYVCIGRGQA